MNISIKFLGAAGTVTGSKYLLKIGNKNLLIDCGVFQGDHHWKNKNWDNFADSSGISATEVDAVLLTHAHIDHSAYVPRLHLAGFKGPVFATRPTVELCKILLTDFGKIQEEDAWYRGRKEISSHKPPLPFYTVVDAERALPLFRSVSFNKKIEVLPGIFATWYQAGHIIGAASIYIEAGGKSITFSGDLGRYNVPILVDPQPTPLGNLLLLESTYGDRLHNQEPPQIELGKIISRTADRGGVTIIPSFAVGRTQLVLYYLRELKDQGKIPNIPIIVDSPMARDATEVYRNNPQCYDEQALKLFHNSQNPFQPKKMYFIKDVHESKKLNFQTEPMVIIAGSGMLTGGRVQHHLFHKISSPLNTVLFIGYQAKGTKGAWVKSGAETVRLFKQEIPIRAEIAEISGLSAHGDRDEMIRWCNESKEHFKKSPAQVAFVHGEPEVAKSFCNTIKDTFDWKGRVPEYLDVIEV